MIRNAAAVAGVGEKMPTTSTLQNANKQLETLTRKVSSRLPKIWHTRVLSGIFRVVLSPMVGGCPRVTRVRRLLEDLILR